MMVLLKALAGAVVLLQNVVASPRPNRQFGEVYREAKMKTTEVTSLSEDMYAAPEADTKDFRFLQNTTAQYRVSSLPSIPFDIGEMYSGLMPIKTDDLTKALFFLFQPAITGPTDTLTIWLNGGPGCSSLEGFFQENGRFVWEEGRAAPHVNDHAWVNLTNVLWVEYPVGTGFSIGKITAKTEEEIAQDFLGFFKNFQNAFGIKNFKILVTGESYAGRYVPYISAAMLDAKSTEYFDLQGALIYDGCIGAFDTVQQQIPAVPFLKQNQQVMGLEDDFVERMTGLHESCGYDDILAKYLTFPPLGVQPKSFRSSSFSCDIFSQVQYNMATINPCFDIYMVNKTCPTGADPIKPSGSRKAYFDRPDVKTALHAPSSITWSMCGTTRNVFTGGRGGPEYEGDLSLDPIQKVLPQVIDATQRVIVAQGNWDMIILTNGTLMSIQNMTFGGSLGFQQKPVTPIAIGKGGVQHYEKGLLWSEAFEVGHMGPEWAPELSYRHIEWLLKLRESL